MTKTIGILSWSWPEAWLHICNCLHHYLQEEYNAIDDCDYPPYILYNRPLVWFDETGIADIDLVTNNFIQAMTELDSMWVSVIWIACNTLHLLVDKLNIQLQNKICNMVYETVSVCKKQNMKKVLILWSRTSRDTNLYGKYCDYNDISYIHVDDQEQWYIDQIIKKVMWWNNNKDDNNYIHTLISYYVINHKIDWCILWCTELPLAITQEILIPCFDANIILVKKLIDRYKQMSQ